MNEIQRQLFRLQDEKYRRFSVSLIPNIPAERIIGVRAPEVRKMAKALYKENRYESFLHDLPHSYHEENLLHVYILSLLKDYDVCIREIDAFLPYADNWAITDSLSPKVFKKNHEKLIEEVYRWIGSKEIYTRRFGVKTLMDHFLEEDFREEYSQKVSEIKTEEYYLQMMIAWYFATALAKQYDQILPFITGYRLSPFIHNKTIQKAIESYRIPQERKEELKTYRIR